MAEVDLKNAVDLTSPIRQMTGTFVRLCEEAGIQKAFLIGLAEDGRLLRMSTFPSMAEALGAAILAANSQSQS